MKRISGLTRKYIARKMPSWMNLNHFGHVGSATATEVERWSQMTPKGLKLRVGLDQRQPSPIDALKTLIQCSLVPPPFLVGLHMNTSPKIETGTARKKTILPGASWNTLDPWLFCALRGLQRHPPLLGLAGHLRALGGGYQVGMFWEKLEPQKLGISITLGIPLVKLLGEDLISWRIWKSRISVKPLVQGRFDIWYDLIPGQA